MRIFLVRHGESEGNTEQRFIGANGKYPLTEVGKEQARNAVRILRNYDIDSNIRLFTSPTIRALETAGIIAKQLSINYAEDARLREIELGKLEGLLKTEVDAKYAKVIQNFSERPSECELPEGESIPEVQQRMLSFVYDRLDEGTDLILVAHDMVIRTFLVHAMNMTIDFLWSLSPTELASGKQSLFEYGDQDLPLGSVTLVNYRNGEFEVESIGVT